MSDHWHSATEHYELIRCFTSTTANTLEDHAPRSAAINLFCARSRGESCGRVLRPQEEPSLGAHIATARHYYLHHGIYVGGFRVVHYAGWGPRWQRGPVEEVSLDQFSRGQLVWTKYSPDQRFGPNEIVNRARSRIGEDRYRLLSNNCEHFSEWCLHGEPRSYQVEALHGWVPRVLPAIIRLATRRRPKTHTSGGVGSI
jgi:hypothetical protein